jgi:hypothetical protein
MNRYIQKLGEAARAKSEQIIESSEEHCTGVTDPLFRLVLAAGGLTLNEKNAGSVFARQALQDFAGYPPDLGVVMASSFRVKKPTFVSFGDKLARKQLETAFLRLFS